MKYIICILHFFLLSCLCAQMPTSGLVAHYTFDNNATDYSGNNNHGQLTGGVTTGKDRFENACGALEFNGVDGYIRVPASVSLKSPVSAMTITAWFKIEEDKTPGKIRLILLSKSGVAGKGEAKAQYRFLLTHNFGDAQGHISLSQEVTAADNNYNAHPIETDQWYFLAMVYEESWANIFLNGKLISQTIVKKPFTANDLDLEIGRDMTAGAKYFHGALDDLRIYNRGLTPFEVSSLFNDEAVKEKGQGISFTMPETIRKNTDAGKCSAIVTYKEPVATIACGKVELKQTEGLPSGSAFSVGEHVISYEADASTGLAAEEGFDVIITDKELPVLRCPADISAESPANAKGAKVDYALPTVTDNCPNHKLELVSGIASGNEFPLGITTVRYKATDASGNVAECSFKVTVTAAKAAVRVLHCPDEIVRYTGADVENALVKYDVPYIETDGNKVLMKKTKGFSSGSLFRIGKNEIVYESGDTGANNMICRFNIIIKDTIRPVIGCPSDVRQITEPGEKSAKVTYPLPKAADSGNGLSVKLISGLESGSVFPVGTSTVKYETRDEGGNKAECSFKIVVEEGIKQPEKPQPAPAVVAEVKKEAVTKPAETPKAKIKEEAPRETKQIPAPKDEREEKIRQAEKIFLAAEEEKKENVKTEEKPVVATKPEPVKKIEEAPKSSPAPVAEIKKEIVAEVKPATPVIKAEKPKDTAPAKSPKSAPPIQVKCPDNMMKNNDEGRCGSFVNYPTPEIKSGQEVKIVQTKGNESGKFFTTGTTMNTFSASDLWMQTRECSFSVTVKDHEAPVFSCPQDTVIMLPANRRGIIYYYKDPVVKDNCKLDSLIQVAGAKNGCFLEIGVHPFIYKATDAAGNFEMCTHSVIIKEAPPAPSIEPPKKLDAELSLGSDSVHYEYRAEVKDCFLTVFIYDDGEEDNDIVSVIFNGQVILNKEMIRVKEHGMIKRSLVLDGGNENYLISKAWNTGKYGLNTLKIDIYEGNIENEKKELKYLKPVMSKVLHSKPGNAGGIILKCSQ